MLFATWLLPNINWFLPYLCLCCCVFSKVSARTSRLQRASEGLGGTSQLQGVPTVSESEEGTHDALGERIIDSTRVTTADFVDDLVDEGEDDGVLESQAERVEAGDTYVVYTDRPENGDCFFLVLCDLPVHNNKATFTDGWGCTWPKDTMVISGTYYRRVRSVGRGAGAYRYELLQDEPKAWNYSHLVVQARVDLQQYKSNKKNPRFRMSEDTRETILSNVEERQTYNAH